VQESSNSVTVALDYLNPVQPHKETVLVDLICDGDVESIRALGGGEGWSVQYHTLAEAVRMAYIFAFTGFLVLVLAAITSTAMLILSTSTDSAVSQALITLWNSGYIRLGTVVLTVGVLTVAFLALWGERKSGIPFYKRIFFWMPRALLRQAVDAIFKRRLVP
jgi:hypothetical protein